jgi:uncharacterized protein (DUF433 family)
MKETIISSDPEILGGTPVFRGTRVPVQTLFDYIKHDSVKEFLIGFPHISREMVDEVLDLAAKSTTRTLRMNKRDTAAA